MRIKSKAQERKLFALEGRGQLKKGTARREAREVKGKVFKHLPQHVKPPRHKKRRG